MARVSKPLWAGLLTALSLGLVPASLGSALARDGIRLTRPAPPAPHEVLLHGRDILGRDCVLKNAYGTRRFKAPARITVQLRGMNELTCAIRRGGKAETRFGLEGLKSGNLRYFSLNERVKAIRFSKSGPSAGVSYSRELPDNVQPYDESADKRAYMTKAEKDASYKGKVVPLTVSAGGLGRLTCKVGNRWGETTAGLPGLVRITAAGETRFVCKKTYRADRVLLEAVVPGRVVYDPKVVREGISLEAYASR